MLKDSKHLVFDLGAHACALPASLFASAVRLRDTRYFPLKKADELCPGWILVDRAPVLLLSLRVLAKIPKPAEAGRRSKPPFPPRPVPLDKQTALVLANHTPPAALLVDVAHGLDALRTHKSNCLPLPDDGSFGPAGVLSSVLHWNEREIHLFNEIALLTPDLPGRLNSHAASAALAAYHYLELSEEEKRIRKNPTSEACLQLADRYRAHDFDREAEEFLRFAESLSVAAQGEAAPLFQGRFTLSSLASLVAATSAAKRTGLLRLESDQRGLNLHFDQGRLLRLDGDTAPGSSPHDTLLALGKGDYRFHESSKPTATPDSKAPSVDSLTHELASRLSPKDFDAA